MTKAKGASVARRAGKRQPSNKAQPSSATRDLWVDPSEAKKGRPQLAYSDDDGNVWTFMIGEDFRDTSVSILDVIRRRNASGEDGNALMWLTWALGNAALQTGNIDAAEVLLAVSAALDPRDKALFTRFHRLSRHALRKAVETCRFDEDYLRAFGSFVMIAIVTKADLGRALVKTYRDQQSRANAPKSKDATMRRLQEALSSAAFQTQRLVDILQIGQTRLGVLKGVSREDLLRRVRSVFRGGLDPEQAAVAILHAAGITYKEAHNMVNAAENMKLKRKQTKGEEV